jgi:hypothetical protein
MTKSGASQHGNQQGVSVHAEEILDIIRRI